MLKIMPPAGWKQGPLHQPGTLLLFGGQGHSSLHGCRVLGTGESWLFSGGRWAELMLEKSMEEPVVSLGTSTWERRNLVLVLDCSEPGDTGRVPRVWDKHPHVCALVWAKKGKVWAKSWWSEGLDICSSLEPPTGTEGRGHPPPVVVVHRLRAISVVGWGLCRDCDTGHLNHLDVTKSNVFSHRKLLRASTVLFQHTSTAGAMPEHRASSLLLVAQV